MSVSLADMLKTTCSNILQGLRSDGGILDIGAAAAAAAAAAAVVAVSDVYLLAVATFAC